MTKLEVQRDQFKKALSKLEEVLNEPKSEIVRDSAIKRFEFSLDIAWKAVKSYLEEVHGVVSNSPKEVFREAYKQGLIDYDEKWLEMIDDRNEIVHMYKEELAEELYGKLKGYLQLFKELFVKLSQIDSSSN